MLLNIYVFFIFLNLCIYSVWSIEFQKNICAGTRYSIDAITILGQKKHSSYDSSHPVTLMNILNSLHKYYPYVNETDILIWHEGDFQYKDVEIT
jgi:hypothetical protein